jgi:hypothetical protein
MKRVTLANAVTVNAGAWSPVYAVKVSALPAFVRNKLEVPAEFLVSMNQSWTAELGSSDTLPATIADCYLEETIPGKTANNTYKAAVLPFYPCKPAGYIWIRVKNDGVSAATLTISIWG